MDTRGFIQGADGHFNPKANITRAEVVKILDSSIDGFYHNAGNVTENTGKITIVNTGDVVLQGAAIQGDLILSEGIAAGTVTLDKMSVTGRVLVRGGAAVIIKGDSNIANLELTKRDGAVAVKV